MTSGKKPNQHGPLTADRRTPKPPKRKAKRKTKPATQGGIRSALLRVVLFPFRVFWGFTWRVGLLVSLVTAIAVFYVSTTLPEVEDMVDGRARGSVTLTDRNNTVFAWRGEQYGGSVSATTISPYLKNAVIATEDKRFYMHPGLDPRGIASAIRINMREGRSPLSGNGGSTITQQTAKLLCLGVPYDASVWESEAKYEADCRRTTIWRKVKEAVYAMAMEVRFTKDEILTIYLNRAFLGAGARGFEAASQRYFGISAKQVDASQAAMLAGLLKAPTRFAPTNNLKRSQDRGRVVLGLMEAQGYLTKGEAEFARVKPATLSPAASARAGGYFADWVMQSTPSYFTQDTTEDVLIRTTLDRAIQSSTEAAIEQVFAEKVSKSSKAQVAVVVMSPDGAVRAMVGGRGTPLEGAYNRASQSRRQTGSTFKPFVFATALEMGVGPFDVVRDEPVTYDVPGSGAWSPKNFTKKFKGNMTVTQALADSVNVPAVKLSEFAGRDLVKRVARDFGMQGDLPDGPAIALGTSESSVLEMTGAYAGILNGGSSVKPYGVVDLRLQGENAPMFSKTSGIGERVISRKSAQDLTYMMHQVIEVGTGRRARINGVEVAGKTGTTQAARDAWFIGFTSDYVVGVWMGYDDNTPLKGVTGSGLPADIWREVIERIVAQNPSGPLPMSRLTAPAPIKPQQPAPAPRKENQVEKVIIDLLKGILGR